MSGDTPARDGPIAAAWMLALTNSFPSLRGVLAIWVPRYLDEWVSGPEARPGARVAGQFVLSVYDRRAHWRCGRFDFHTGMERWDQADRRAFLDWVQDPWYPEARLAGAF